MNKRNYKSPVLVALFTIIIILFSAESAFASTNTTSTDSNLETSSSTTITDNSIELESSSTTEQLSINTLMNSSTSTVDSTSSSTTNSFISLGSKSDEIISSEASVEEATDLYTKHISFNLRLGDEYVITEEINLSTTTYSDQINNIEYDLATTGTVFSALVQADNLSEKFSISNAQYNAEFDSFYIACLEIDENGENTEYCDNWNYVVDDEYPSIGMDKYELNGEENVYVYFSTPWKITTKHNEVEVNSTTTVKTWRYAYNDPNTEWEADPNTMIDISQPNASSTGWWDENLTVSTTYSNEDGFAELIFSEPGIYNIKITSSDWTKWSQPVQINVINQTNQTVTSTLQTDSATVSTQSTNSYSSTSDNELISNTDIEEAANRILSFLESEQDQSGKIKDGGTSDWSTISFGAADIDSDTIKKEGKSLIDYVKDRELTETNEINLCAAYPRHILALLAGGIESDDQQIKNLREKIENDCYELENDNNYGEIGINDDVFALIALIASGSDTKDNQILTDILNEISDDQTEDGAFTWVGFPSADITGAVINTLIYSKENDIEIDENLIDNARQYLKETQLDDGGWGMDDSDVLTTSWVMMGINALGEDQLDWQTDSGKNPWYVLVQNLNDEGYYESEYYTDEVDWFATKHAVPALLGKSWPIVFESDNEENPNSNTTPSETKPENTSDEITDNTSTSTTDNITTDDSVTTEKDEHTKSPTSTPADDVITDPKEYTPQNNLNIKGSGDYNYEPAIEKSDDASDENEVFETVEPDKIGPEAIDKPTTTNSDLDLDIIGLIRENLRKIFFLITALTGIMTVHVIGKYIQHRKNK
ncbi:MAG: hypothetical protein GF349_03080 [Candidatus Magasanikbacteria bacterium]|nr:hypothetical protein [Candidatus Magasanikbacteria bacterium]